MDSENKKSSFVSPEQLETNLQIAGSGTLFLFIAVLLLTGGFVIWGIFGEIRITVSVSLVATEEWVTAYVPEDEKNMISPGALVETVFQEGRVVSVSDETKDFHDKDLYPVYITLPNELQASETTAEIVVMEASPFSYLIGV